MRIVKTWRGEPEITDEDIKEMKDWRKELREWTDTTGAFSNMFGGFLGMFGVFAFIMFFYGGCSYEGLDRDDKIINPEENDDADPAAWVLFK